MHNFAKLSPASQTFITRLKGGSTLNIAAAKAVADKLPLPSFEVANAGDQYTATQYDEARAHVNRLNEVVPINAREVLALVETFWKVRYYTVFPPKQVMVTPGGCLSHFMGFGMQVPQGVLDDIRCGGEDLVRNLNGFNFIVGDLCTPIEAAQTPDTPPSPDAVEASE